MVEALVEYEYTATQEDELTLKPGDIITNIVKQDGGWWEGTLSGKRGVFPDNFVKEIKQTTKDAKKTKLDSKVSNVHKLAENLQNQISLDATGPPKRTGGGTAKKKLRAKVTYSYAPVNEDELELKVGEIVEIENKEEDGWWEGTAGGKKGVFPSNFVDLIDEESAGSTDLTESQEEEVKEIKGKKPKGFGFGNIFADGGGANVLQKMKKKQSVEDVKLDAKVNGKKAPHSKDPPPLPSKDTEKPVEKAKVLFPYTAENEDELSLDEGQIITILDKELEDSGWWKGELHGVVGVFPDNFVELLPPEEKPRRPAPPAPQGKARPAPPAHPDEPKKDVKESQKDTPIKKPGPPLLTKKPTTKQTDPKLIAQTDDHKVQEQKTGLYIDTAEPNPPLKHPNKDRPKAPAKRPPTKNTKDSSPEGESQNGPVSPPDHPVVSAAKPESISPRSASKEKNITGQVSSTEFAELRHELDNLRTNSVPRKQYEQLQAQVTKMQAQMEEMKKTFDKKLYDLMCEVDEEKKLRQNALVEMQRVKKLVAPQ